MLKLKECLIFVHFESLSLSKVAGTKIGRPVVRKSLDQVRRSLWKRCRTAATPVAKETVKVSLSMKFNLFRQSAEFSWRLHTYLRRSFSATPCGMAPKIPRTAGAELLEADGQAGSGAQQVGDGEG